MTDGNNTLFAFHILPVCNESHERAFDTNSTAFNICYWMVITCLHSSARQVVIGHEACRGEGSFFTTSRARTNLPINTDLGTFDYLVHITNLAETVHTIGYEGSSVHYGKIDSLLSGPLLYPSFPYNHQ
jgi:hypothetical protein